MAIKVGGTEVVDNNRQLKNIASVDATTVAALGTAGVGGGGGSTELTAASSLSAGQAVVVNSSGQAAAVTKTIGSVSWQQDLGTGGGEDIQYHDAAFHPNANNTVSGVTGCGIMSVFFKKSGSITRKIYSVNKNTGEVVSSGDTTFISGSEHGNGISLTYGSTPDRALLAFANSSTNNLRFYPTNYYSGTNFNSGSQLQLPDNSHNYTASKRIANCYDASHDKFFVSATKSGSSLPIYVISVTPNGNGASATKTTETTVSASGWSNNFKDPEIASDNNGQFVMAVYDASQGKCKAVAFTLSGTTFSYGSIVEVSNEAQFNDSMSLRYDASSGKFVITARSTSGIDIRSLTVGGSNAITLGTAVNVSGSARANCLVDGGNGNLGLCISSYTRVDYRSVTVASNGNITLGSAILITDSSNNNGWDTHRNMVCRSTTDTNTAFVSYVLLANYQLSNLHGNEFHQTVTSDNTSAIGVTEAAINSGATGDITVIGGVNDQQSGLTAGTKYYFNQIGQLTSSEVADAYAGLALSATKLLVKG